MASLIILIILIIGGTLAVLLVHGWFELTNGIGFIPLPRRVLDAVAAVLELKPGETLIDLGCGDGRVLRAAKHAEPQIQAAGVENNPFVALIARLFSRDVRIRRGNLFTFDIKDADVVFLYLHPSINGRVAAKLERELKLDARVVSLQFELPNWPPERVIELDGPAHANRLYLYSLAKIKGRGDVR